MFSPLQLKMMLHYHCSPTDFPGLPAKTFDNEADTLQRLGLIEHTGLDVKTQYQATEKLHTYCEALCRTPLPIQMWVMPE